MSPEAKALLDAMMNATPEMLDQIRNYLGPCEGCLTVLSALEAMREFREIRKRGHP